MYFTPSNIHEINNVNWRKQPIISRQNMKQNTKPSQMYRVCTVKCLLVSVITYMSMCVCYHMNHFQIEKKLYVIVTGVYNYVCTPSNRYKMTVST